MSEVEDEPEDSQPASSIDQFQVYAWLQRAFAALRESRWAPHLSVDGVSVLDALQSECMVTLMRFAREGGAEKAVLRLTLRQRLIEPARKLGYAAKAFLNELRARRGERPVEPVSFVFFPTEPTHFQVLDPIYKELTRRGRRCAYFTSRPRLWQRMRAGGAEVILAASCWPSEIAAARARGRGVARQIAADPGVTLPPFEPLGSPESLVAHFRWLITTYLPTIAEAATIGRLLVERVRPEVLIVGNDNTLEGHVLARVAKSLGLPTASSMHGNVAGNPLHGQHIVDRFVLYGEASRRTMISYGQNPAQLAVTGPTHLDRRPQQSGVPEESVRRQLGVDGTRPLVLGLLSGARQFFSLPHHLQQVEALMRVSESMPELQLVAKLHRVDQVGFYDQVRQKVPGARLQVVAYAAPGYPARIFEWLQGCKLVITGASAAAVEAMFMDVPVITMDLCDELQHIDFINAGATLHIRTIDALPAAVRAALENTPEAQEARRRAREYLLDCYGPLDGQASARAADEICALCPSGGPKS